MLKTLTDAIAKLAKEESGIKAHKLSFLETRLKELEDVEL
jgi:hypothetical protein